MNSELPKTLTHMNFLDLSDLTDTGLFVIHQQRLVHFNQKLCALFGCEDAKSIERILSEILDPQEVESFLAKSAAEGDAAKIYRKNVKYLFQQGHLLFLELSLKRLDHNGQTVVAGSCLDVTGRKLAEEQMQRSRMDRDSLKLQLEAVLRGTSDGICMLDFRWNIQYANHSFCRMLQSGANSTQDMVGQNLEMLFNDQDEGRLYLKGVNQSIRNRGVDQREIKMKSLSGELFWAQISMVRLDPSQTCQGYVATISDITERKQAEAALIESEYRYKSIVENSRDVIMLTGPQGQIIYLSPACPAVLGWEPADLVGTMGEIVHKDDREKVQSALADALRGTCGSDFEYRVVTRNGETKWVSHSWSPLYQDSNLSMIISTVQDITRRIKSEQARHRLSTAVEQAAESIIITDAKGKIEYVNPSFEGSTGYRPVEMLGKNIRMFEHQANPSQTYQGLWHTIQQGQSWHGRLTNNRKDGSEFMELVTISPVRDEQGKIVNYVWTSLDVTREVDLERELKQAELLSAVGQAITGVAHYIKNIINNLHGNLYLMGRSIEEHNVEQSRNWIDMFGRNADRLKTLVEEMLSYTSATPMILKPLNLNQVIREIIHECSGRGHAINVNLIGLLDEKIPELEGDSRGLHDALLNMVSNALDACEDNHGTRVIIATSWKKDEDVVEIKINDDGPGIPPETLDRIFKPFFSTKAKGSGIGLAMVEKISLHHHGSVSVKSEPRNTTFMMRLPRQQPLDTM